MSSVTNTNKFHIHPTLLFQINMLICQQLSKSLSNNAKADQRQTKMFHQNPACGYPCLQTRGGSRRSLFGAGVDGFPWP